MKQSKTWYISETKMFSHPWVSPLSPYFSFSSHLRPDFPLVPAILPIRAEMKELDVQDIEWTALSSVSPSHLIQPYRCNVLLELLGLGIRTNGPNWSSEEHFH
jgi:hypothetical protein